ncbi:MAG: hypothetical protein AB7U82_25775 [Blastocatellales bacterium]
MKSSPNPKRQPRLSELIDLINEIVAYWKKIARMRFTNVYPGSDPSEFERIWPMTLTNFFLMETIRVAMALGPLFEGRDN